MGGIGREGRSGNGKETTMYGTMQFSVSGLGGWVQP